MKGSADNFYVESPDRQVHENRYVLSNNDEASSEDDTFAPIEPTRGICILLMLKLYFNVF